MILQYDLNISETVRRKEPPINNVRAKSRKIAPPRIRADTP